MLPPIVVLDACVLYPAPLRDLFMRLSVARLFRARWTNRIHDEWIRSLLSDRPDLTPVQLARTRALMDLHTPDCLVTGYERLIKQLRLPDPNDRHVLAAAIRARAEAIVTANTSDFPDRTLRPYGVRARHPDEFVEWLFARDQEAVIRAVRAQRAALRRPRVSVEELLGVLAGNGLHATARRLRGVAATL